MMQIFSKPLAALCGLLSFVPVAVAVDGSSTPLAFPGATGFGSHATGGRNGTVYRVTNLNDNGPGSFRDAVSQPNRIVIFEVGGYIDLKSRLHVASDLTIAGQTAPGEGVGTKNHSVSFSDSKNVIVRYMRFRQGNVEGEEKKSAVNINNGSEMIFDHVSIQWGRWDTVDMTECKNMTMEYCIIGPGVPPQRFGCLCESDNVTFTHNLWIDNKSRNPKAKGTIQYVNNVIYNWGGGGGFVEGHSAADHYADVVGNYFVAGPESGEHHAFVMGALTDKIYASGNYIDSNANGTLDGEPIVDKDLGTVTIQKKPFSNLDLPIQPAAEAFAAVVAEAGCSLHRDSVDRLLIDQVHSLGRDGKMVTDIAEVGGPGEIKGGPAVKVNSATGLPDSAKLQDSSTGGYIPIEVYINNLTGLPSSTTKP